VTEYPYLCRTKLLMKPDELTQSHLLKRLTSAERGSFFDRKEPAESL